MRYPFTVFQAQANGQLFWIAESASLSGCAGQGGTLEAAYAELEENEKDWLETAEKYGVEIPPVPVTPLDAYSGKFTVRVAPHIHREAAEHAKKQSISLNQYINDAIVAQNSRMSTIDYIVPQVKEVANIFKNLLFSSTATYSRGNSIVVSSFNSGRPTQNRRDIGVIPGTMAVQ